MLEEGFRRISLRFDLPFDSVTERSREGPQQEWQAQCPETYRPPSDIVPLAPFPERSFGLCSQ
jgi:hypothetical protein